MRDYSQLWPFQVGIVLQAVMIAAGLAGTGWIQRVWFPALLTIFLVLGAWIVVESPSPPIDVVVVTRAALRALLRGRDPYQITIPNIYGPDTPFYDPSMIEGDRVRIGYPYPPLTLLLAVPGHLWLGDYRFSHVAALAAAAALMGAMQRDLIGKLAAALFLTTPRIFYVIEQGWSEPIAVLMLAAGVFCLVRCPRATPWAMGMLVASKQYLVLAAPLLWRVAAGSPRFLKSVGAAALLVTIPLAIRSPRSFAENVILLQAREPFRGDSLSYLSWLAANGWGRGTMAWALVAAMVASAIVMWRARATAAGFAAGLGFVCLVTFSFGSKAFVNYYFFVVAAACCSMAAAPRRSTAAR
jgi:hypothetical protein